MGLERGRTIHLTMTNRTMLPHAIHLHGRHFAILSRSGFANREGDIRNIVLVGAVEIAFVADNPGRWMIHCHMRASVLEHVGSVWSFGLTVKAFFMFWIDPFDHCASISFLLDIRRSKRALSARPFAAIR
nr:multicopper oxidase domain-containing protein [Roseobacter sp. HKCCA0434]